MDLKELGILGDQIANHWYYQSKAKAMLAFLQGIKIIHFLDIGAGSGFFSRYLLKHSKAQTACCIDTHYDREWTELQDGKLLNFKNSSQLVAADLVLMMDVLEHVEDDVSFLKASVEQVSTGTFFLISVPAFQWLWSDHDVFLGHHRRYSLPQIEKVILQSGLTLRQSSYFFASIFPWVVMIRLASRFFTKSMQNPKSQLKMYPLFLNHILTCLCSSEKSWMRYNRMFGLTAFCLAQKIK